MKIYTFIADSAPAAVAQIRAQLGPDAVVLNVRQLKAEGLQKLWKKPQIEVLAHLPEMPPSAPDPLAALTELRREIADLRQQIPVPQPTPALPAPPPTQAFPASETSPSRVDFGPWKVGAILEQAGVLPRHVQLILEEIEAAHGSNAPESLRKQFDLARAAILKLALNPVGTASTGVHIFVGPAGSGKTTVLSKILAKQVLIDGAPARVLRLDGSRANTAESLSIYAEILGAQVDRCLTDESRPFPGETVYIDLPGGSDAEVKKLVAEFPGAQVHLVLNAAYETSTLLNQLRAYSTLPISDLVFTHLDEEVRWGKLINFCFGTKFPLTLLSAGQNVPGELVSASVEKIITRVIPSK